MLGEGVNETFFGTELATTRVGLLLLHDPRNMQPRVMPTRAAPDANLRMSPFLWENESVLENTQCRVCAFFQQLQAGIGSVLISLFSLTLLGISLVVLAACPHRHVAI